ncbi:NAD(+) diphosphatase [Paludibacterium paludis]|uniref:NAD(+) diphosphatase n=1 Tax=Paludibacterium paludis TaxID=1225769 RepID=A0A918P5H0_9NEIS|nr:NAD(+) diphosphatase [Paludibacterium paludis]GGY25703.1 NADH pyrophosphatase [Paludibacterium paludis]
MMFTLDAPARANGPALWIIWNGNLILHIDGRLPEARPDSPLTLERHVASLGDRDCRTAELVGDAPRGAEWRTLRHALLDAPRPLQQALSRAWQLIHFERSHRFCSHCASPLVPHAHDSGKGCPSCGAVHYPRISPAMMVTVTRGREILLARAPHFAEGMYSALAGFVEPGETLEQCVHRETFEEVGVRIGNLAYAGSQQWPFPHSLMLAFTAEYLSGDIVPQEGEIADARWFSIDALPTLPPPASIAAWLIRHTIDRINAR